jgi:tetratricopeptide (TPR) repeat protein
MGLTNLGTLQGALEHYSEAIESFRKSLAIFEAKVGKDHPHCSFPLYNIAEVLRETGRYREAVPYYERALAIRVGAKMPPSPVADARFGLARALLGDDPKTRKRARSEATTAAAEYIQAEDPASAAEVKTWPAKY